MKPNLHHPNRGWIPHTSTRCPVPNGTIIRVQFGFGVSKHDHPAENLNWKGFNRETSIHAYKILREAGE